MYAIAILRYRKPLEEVVKHLDSHRAYCQGLKQEGLLIASGPLVPRWPTASKTWPISLDTTPRTRPPPPPSGPGS